MRRKINIVILMIVCIFSSLTVFAASEADGYDFRADEMEDAPEIENIKELENSILQDLYAISPSVEPYSTVELDYEDAVKTYNYTPETFLELAKSSQFVHDVLTNANYNWKIPVDIRDDGIDYAVVYQDEEGWNYYTASAGSIGKQRLEYLIYKENLDSLFPSISAAEDILVLSISNIKTDVIIVSNGETLSAIPFASRPDLLGIDNKEVYSLEEFAGKVESYLSSTQITNDYSDGGVGKASSNYIVVFFMFVLLAVSFTIIKKKGGQAMKLYRQYLIVGGMPECVLQFVETKDYILVRHIQDTILASYLNDMSKYKDGQEPGSGRDIRYICITQPGSLSGA